jgi:hypothetical protein
MILGGCDLNNMVLQSFELYNWKTGTQCVFPSLPNPVLNPAVTIMDNTPVYCGGNGINYNYFSECFKLDQNTSLWVQVSVFLTK